MDGREPAAHLDEAFQLALFRAIAANQDGYVSCIDRQRRVLFLNRTLTRDLSSILGRRIEEFLTEPHREAAIAGAERAFTLREPQEVEISAALADGRRRHLLTRFVPFVGPRGEELALQFTTDISERRRLAEELEQSIEFRRQVLENLPEFVALVDREHRVVWINRVPDYTEPSKVVGRKLEEFGSLTGIAGAVRAIDTAFEKGTIEYYESAAAGGSVAISAEGDAGAASVASLSTAASASTDSASTDSAGTGSASGAVRMSPATRWYGVRVVPILSGSAIDNVLLITADLTERKLAERALKEKEEQLHRAQRLDSLGQLAGGIAHDFNNLLQVIHGNLSFVREGLANGEQPFEDVEQALIATERAGELTQHLLAIGRRSRLAPKPVFLGALIEQSMRMLRRAIPETIKLAFEPPREPFVVQLDAPQFEQVLINLCVNARDAMPQGGSIRVRIEPDGASHVVVSVIDSGSGISPENLGRVFEPFFTTKGALGSGLGLAVAAGIVAAHGGEMSAESDGLHGTTMKVRLPRAPDAPEAAPPSLQGAERGSGVILVAEDEQLVRAQAERMLERAGYTVFSVPDGVEAVATFRKHHPQIDLLLLDVVMPELDGWRAYLQMEEIAPGVPVLFTTGYAASVLPPDFAARGARMLSKPYQRERLLAEVRDLLATRRASPGSRPSAPA